MNLNQNPSASETSSCNDAHTCWGGLRSARKLASRTRKKLIKEENESSAKQQQFDKE